MTGCLEHLREKLRIAAEAHTAAQCELDDAIMKEAERALAAKGITNGAKVKVGKEVGIYEGMTVEYGRARPYIRKITKTGKPHASQKVYVWHNQEVELAE
jgi:hypothetical protein